MWVSADERAAVNRTDPSRNNGIQELENPDADDDSPEALADIWIDKDRTKLGEYKIERACLGSEHLGHCSLSIFLKGRQIRTFENDSANKIWLKYGFFNFLGGENKQLVVFTYSGGAHCCYGYTIFDLTPKFTVLYDTTKSDSADADDVGNELVPVDIDQDGVYEFYQDVMAFDYDAPGGHSTSTFPPAIFAFDKSSHKFVPANKRFPEFVLNRLRKNLADLKPWAEDSAKRGTVIPLEELDEISVREKFLYMVYAGQKDQAWKYFNDNYRFEFREKFRHDFLDAFQHDPTYLSIYGQ